MRRLSYFLAMTLLATAPFFVGCKKKTDEEDTTSCESQTFPSTTGTATVDILNYTNLTADGFTNIDVAAGDVLSFAVEITKGTNRPQKLRIYQTDCVNKKGDIVSLAGQPGAEDNDTRLDLRNTDAAQIRQFAYTVPTGMSTIYLNIEIDESNSTYTYKRVKLNVSGSGIIDTWSGVTLGGNMNSNASRMSSGTGQTYLACDAAANIEYIDITYAVSTLAGNYSYLCSNPARFLSPVSLTASSASCGEDGTLSTAGGNATYFKTASANFDTATDSDLSALTVSSSDPQYVQISATGTVYEFLNSKGKKGLIKVNSGTLDDAAASINVSVKVQR